MTEQKSLPLAAAPVEYTSALALSENEQLEVDLLEV